jgi:hypothetical protein
MCYYINSLYVVLCLLDISVVCVGYITCMSIRISCMFRVYLVCFVYICIAFILFCHA